MISIEFFEYMSERFMEDYRTKVLNEDDGLYDFSPRYFQRMGMILFFFGFKAEDEFTLADARHIIARLSGFSSWTDLVKSSEAERKIGKFLLVNWKCVTGDVF